MKKIFVLSFLLSCFVISVQAQEIHLFSNKAPAKNEVLDSTIMECTYDYSYRQDTTKKEVYKTDRMVLRIGRKFSSFYSYNKAIIDSIVASGNADAIMSDISKYKFGVSYRIFKDKAEDKIIYTDALGPANYKYEEPVPKFGWEIKSDTLRILGYICHMATCDFRGRKYTVWYCPSIPLPEGPWKFCGLPGLIFKVSDNNGDYIFSISGIKKVCKPITSEKKQYIKTTLAKYLKTYRRYNENPIAFMRASGVKIIVKNMDGTQYEAKVRKMKYDFIEKEIK